METCTFALLSVPPLQAIDILYHCISWIWFRLTSVAHDAWGYIQEALIVVLMKLFSSCLMMRNATVLLHVWKCTSVCLLNCTLYFLPNPHISQNKWANHIKPFISSSFASFLYHSSTFHWKVRALALEPQVIGAILFGPVVDSLTAWSHITYSTATVPLLSLLNSNLHESKQGLFYAVFRRKYCYKLIVSSHNQIHMLKPDLQNDSVWIWG